MKQVTETDRLIGERITAARKLAGISQTTLATAIGVTFQQVQKYEKGLNRISAGKIVEIARLLGIGHAELLGSTDDVPGLPSLSRAAISLAQAFDRLPESASKAQLRRLVMALADDVPTERNEP
ncbi:helix-turn-helix domain-containing protein [Methylobacterium brachythecii]|uniref:Transcriptional regulator n=1 Tax=Methylobacterium brachythecii TaxID=1176177 RepID=A0A7W6F6Y0_9HYPH|nr:helix-turn-helix transcriptional regulator [Methylobacterium brachythecii]MBB3902793.1 transcriptional regulator with XRE-family HTH domain [Methylobacterium brachythecii]GLS43718.1 transcriptional regulator [Methylobacterium brachythecii]